MTKTTNNYYFYDTSALLEKGIELFSNEEKIVISTTVISELEEIKTSTRKDDNIKETARKVIRLLRDNKDKYEVVVFKDFMLNLLEGFETSGKYKEDYKILAAAVWYDTTVHPDETIFVTNDLSLANIANLFFGDDSIMSVQKESDRYTGFRAVQMTNDEMADFYNNKSDLQQYINEYLIVKDDEGNIVDTLCYAGEEGYRNLRYGGFESTLFGEVKPKRKDIYQAMAFDSLLNNQITLLKGPAGSGKSLIALSYLFSLLEMGKIDKIIIFCNTVATKNSARLGFYPGSRDQKLLDSQIGNFLSSKFGDKMIAEDMIAKGKLILLPMSDVRGYDTSGMHAGIYITEAQNMDISLMKLALQRIGEDSVVVIDGDCEAQVDLQAFNGANNGMKRLSQVFRGQDFYGEVELQNIHRSRIGRIAEQM